MGRQRARPSISGAAWHGLSVVRLWCRKGPSYRSRCCPDGLGLTPVWGTQWTDGRTCRARRGNNRLSLCRNGCVGYTLYLTSLLSHATRRLLMGLVHPSRWEGHIWYGRLHWGRRAGDCGLLVLCTSSMYRLGPPPSQGRPPLLLARWSVLGGKRPLISNSIINAVHFRCREFWLEVNPGVGMRSSAGSIVQTHFICPFCLQPRERTHRQASK